MVEPSIIIVSADLEQVKSDINDKNLTTPSVSLADKFK